MLDTNTSSYIIKENSNTWDHLRKVNIGDVCISVITEAELLLGVAMTLAKHPEAKKLPQEVKEFLLRVEILPWDSVVADVYAKLRAACENEGKPLGSLDMLIAAHSVAEDATLVTNDKAFYNLAHYLKLEDWTKPLIQ